MQYENKPRTEPGTETTHPDSTRHHRNPDYLFSRRNCQCPRYDNEKVIQGNLEKFFKDKTVVIVAHRLSTVKNADQIVVLKEGEITEKGTHDELITRQGDYYRLVKNQLELSA